MPDESRPVGLDKVADPSARRSVLPAQSRPAEAERAFRVPAFRRLQVEQLEPPVVAQALVERDEQVRAELTNQVSALRENLRLRAEQLCELCTRPLLSSDGAGAIQRRIEVADAAKSIERLLARSLGTLAKVHEYERLAAVKRSARQAVKKKERAASRRSR